MGSQPIRIQLRKILREKSCGKFLQENLVGNSAANLVRNAVGNLVGNSVGNLARNAVGNLAGNSGEKFLW